MLGRSSRSRNFFRKLVVNGVNSSKAAIQNDCLMRLYDADAELKAISSELDSFDGKKDPIRCNLLVNQLRTAQDKVISLLFQLMDDCNCKRASRDYRMKFPDEILLSEGSESLNGQIWFGAECLSAGSNILNHTKESIMLRPMAKTLTTHLDSLRNELRDLVIDGGGASHINQTLTAKMVAFDHIFATFEYEYVRTMLPIRTVSEIEKLQEVAVLFSETLIDCVKRGLIKQDDIDEFQPIVMIAIPRLAIVRGLLYKNENPIYTRHKSQMCSLFQPFHGPLQSIRRLLRGLSPHELFSLEKMLANDQSAIESPVVPHRNEAEASSSAAVVKQQDACLSVAEEDEPSTSNNYSNVLMDGLQYPVGQKRCIRDSSPNPQDQNLDSCIMTAPSSSSKSVVTSQNNQETQPIGSSPTSSSSLTSPVECKRCKPKDGDENDVECQVKVIEKHECDKSCLSAPENDDQLEKLIAEFSPSLNNQECPPRASTDSSSLNTASFLTNATANENISADNSSNKQTKSEVKDKPIKANNEDEALLEELFLQQAQQLLHRLFVAISGVADQLQSNFASDLRFILRHIFSSEIEGSIVSDSEENDDEDDESEEREFSNNEQSDSSLPIEQGIEAQEVANLIDLGSDYSLNSPYDYDPPTATEVNYPTSTNSYINASTTNTNGDLLTRYSPSSSLYTSTVVSHQQSSDLVDQDSIRQELLADLMLAADQTELIYESRTSPNEASIMDDARHHQQLVQQNLQNISSRATARSSRHHRQQQQHGHHTLSSNVVAGLNGERRSRHHGGSRSRRTRGPPVWVPDQLVVACSCCNAAFTLFRRRHHCRACGQIFCAECSKFTKNLNCWGYKDPVRVCESCFNQT